MNNDKHPDNMSSDPRTKLQTKYKNHKLEYIINMYIETKYQNTLKKTTQELFESIKEFIPERLEFLKNIDKEYKQLERNNEKPNKKYKRT